MEYICIERGGEEGKKEGDVTKKGGERFKEWGEKEREEIDNWRQG